MAEEEAGSPQPVVSDPGGPARARGSSEGPGVVPEPLEPERPDVLGWSGLDGQAALDHREGVGGRRRRPASGVAGGEPRHSPGPRLSANPYASLAGGAPRSTSTGLTFNLGVLLLWVCGIALMYGSVGSWVHVNGSVGIADFRVSINGIDPGISTLIGVNGWVTFIGGTLIVIFSCFEMTSEELQLGIATTLITAGDGDLRHLRHVPHSAEDLAGTGPA